MVDGVAAAAAVFSVAAVEGAGAFVSAVPLSAAALAAGEGFSVHELRPAAMAVEARMHVIVLVRGRFEARRVKIVDGIMIL